MEQAISEDSKPIDWIRSADQPPIHSAQRKSVKSRRLSKVLRILKVSEWNPLITSEAQSQPSYGSAGFKTCNLKSYKVCKKIKTKKESFHFNVIKVFLFSNNFLNLHVQKQQPKTEIFIWYNMKVVRIGLGLKKSLIFPLFECNFWRMRGIVGRSKGSKDCLWII